MGGSFRAVGGSFWGFVQRVGVPLVGSFEGFFPLGGFLLEGFFGLFLQGVPSGGSFGGSLGVPSLGWVPSGGFLWVVPSGGSFGGFLWGFPWLFHIPQPHSNIILSPGSYCCGDFLQIILRGRKYFF